MGRPSWSQASVIQTSRIRSLCGRMDTSAPVSTSSSWEPCLMRGWPFSVPATSARPGRSHTPVEKRRDPVHTLVCTDTHFMNCDTNSISTFTSVKANFPTYPLMSSLYLCNLLFFAVFLQKTLFCNCNGP